MAELQLAHSALLEPEALAHVRALLADQFADEFTNYDWENVLGGLHALAWEGEDLIGHASVIQRRLLHQGRALRAGYYEGVVVRTDQRGRGHGARMMKELARRTRGVYELSALFSSETAQPFYSVLGWTAWRGPLQTLTPNGVREDPRFPGRVFVLEHSFPLNIDAPLTCDWRDGDPWD
jgi:aminoglycoside 2'-N-acetyltransferase I